MPVVDTVLSSRVTSALVKIKGENMQRYAKVLGRFSYFQELIKTHCNKKDPRDASGPSNDPVDPPFAEASTEVLSIGGRLSRRHS